MRWFKHLSLLRRDPDVARYLALCGRDWLAGYGAFMVIAEVVAENMEPSTPASVTFPASMWQSFTGLHHKSFAKYAGKLRDSCVIDVRYEGDQCTIEIPKLLKWRDEYSRKSGQAPESLRTKSHQRQRESGETDTDTEAEREGDAESLARLVYQDGRLARPPASLTEVSLPEKVDELLSGPHGDELRSNHVLLARTIHQQDRCSGEPSDKFIQAVYRCVVASKDRAARGA